MKVICLPENVAGHELESFKLTLNDEENTYFMDTKSGIIYEAMNYCEDLRSWFIGNHVEEEGGLIILTPVDIIYLILPLLIKNQKQYQTLCDILSENSVSMKLSEAVSLQNADLSVVSSSKKIDEDEFIKYDEDATLRWLQRKVEVTEECLRRNQLSTSVKRGKVAGFVSGREKPVEIKDNLRKFAASLVTRYLPPSLLVKLGQVLKIDLKDEDEARGKAVKSGRAVKRNLDEEDEDAEDAGALGGDGGGKKGPPHYHHSKNNGKDVKKVGSVTKGKTTTGSKQAKASGKGFGSNITKKDTKGMKNIASYFGRR